MTDIEAWLRQHGLDEHIDVFVEQQVRVSDLALLTEDDARELGLPLGPRKRLLAAIGELAASEPATVIAANEVSAGVAATGGDAERRHLTVMFCDLVGSTAMSASMDPEAYRALLVDYQSVARAAIERYQGYIARYMGDGLLVYFGYPQAHEDDAQRAALASLDLVTAVNTLEPRDGVVLQVRIGIATGLVVAGDIIGEGASEERAVLGDTPNLAARLQGIAAPNAIVIAESTAELVAGGFTLQMLGLQSLKGLSSAVPAFQVTGVQETESRFAAATRGPLQPMVGRDDELGLTMSRWRAAVAGEFQLVLVAGEPGIGKSRLVQAVRDGLAREAHVALLYQCSPFFQSSSLQPFVEQLRRAARIEQDTEPSKNLLRLEELLRRNAAFIEHDVVLFATLLGLPCELPPALENAEERRKATIAGLLRHLQGLSTQSPVVAIFEDVHWADPSTLEVLDQALQELKDARVLLLLTYRPEFECPWIGRSQTASLTLSRINPRETAVLASQVAAQNALPEALLARIVERTDGIPLFVEELTRTVTENRAKGNTTDGLTWAAIPSSLHDLLMERLDRLGPAKEIAQAGAIIGREFTAEQAGAILGDEASAESTVPALEVLLASGLVLRHGHGAAGSYIFKHALVQEAAYQTLLQSRRQLLHERAAALLLAHNLPREVVAEHFEKAGQPGEAIAGWHVAGRRAASAGAHREALEHYARALASVPALRSNRESQAIECDLRIGLARNLVVLDRFDEAFDALNGAERLAQDLDDPVRLGLVCHHRGNVWFPLGQIEKCLADQERARQEARRGNSPELEARALGGLCDANYQRGRILTALTFAEQCVELAQSMGLHGVVAGYLGMRAPCRAYLLRLPEAIADGRRSVELALEQKRPRSAVVSYQATGYFLLECGELARGGEALQRGLQLAREIGAGRFVPISLLFLARIAWSEGRIDEAQAMAEEAKRVSDETAPKFTGPWTLGTLLLLARDDKRRHAICTEAAGMLDSGCVSHNHLWFHRDAMDAWLRVGNLEATRAHAALLEAYSAEEPSPWSDFYVRRGRGLAALLQDRDSLTARTEIETLIGQAQGAGLLGPVPMMRALLDGRALPV